MTKKKFAELKLGLLHLKQNVDIPQPNLVIRWAQSQGQRLSISHILSKLLTDSTFLYSLLSHVNSWIKAIQAVTQLTSDVSSGTAGDRRAPDPHVAGVAGGLEFLKSSGVIHGDSKGKNIVIDDGGAPRITDFGLSFFDWKSSSSIETKTRIMVGSFASGDISAVLAAASAYTRSGAGSPRWMGPELLVPEAFHKMSTRPTFESDVFSFRMLIYENIYSGLVPLQDDTDMMAVFQILEGRRPPRPHQVPDWMWRITNKCWVEDFRLRPSIGYIRAQTQPENVLIVDRLGRFIRLWNNFSKTHEPLEIKEN
ncbi:hypothetical protein K443DRAFT_13007 [Laccaria amethystina LaAM-08-1]|uniref:Protein kinase domain-containing protein n=1 Tax=Laccaria amethystina LaAM-08-1 TaxID=1095629 RepID=A0A0C9WWM4_9AGAR|nr:hypothetical protein K443DRAFT_13007 [Laccaria amethystina LaAM-08-1]